MLTLKPINGKLLVLDTEAWIKPGEKYAFNGGILTNEITADLLVPSNESGGKILGECSLDAAISLLMEKEAIQFYMGMGTLARLGGYIDCLSTHPLTDAESAGYAHWVRHHTWQWGIRPNGKWENAIHQERTDEELFSEYKRECYLKRLDGREVEIEWKDDYYDGPGDGFAGGASFHPLGIKSPALKGEYLILKSIK